MRNRIQELEKNIYANHATPLGLAVDFSKIRIGAKDLEDAVFQLSDLKKTNPQLADKGNILRAIDQNDLKTLREVSDFFYRISGIYQRLVRHMAYLYRYDWFVTTYTYDDSVKNEKLIEGFRNSLSTLDNFGMKRNLGEIALKVIRHGVYYGYKIPYKNTISLQELPPNYCRSRFSQGNQPAVEFNMKYFDDAFKDPIQRERFLKLFPKEFTKGYNLYKANKLPPEFPGDQSGWYLLEPGLVVRFTANGEEFPFFISTIPLLIDLDEAQGVDKKKTLQRLLKIIIQKMPMDKNGELIFDPEEAQQLHNNAVTMLKRAIGVDVLTTYADIDVADLDASNTSTQQDDLQRVERQVYNEAGVSQLLFNTDKNIASDKAILNDEATLYNMLLQFEDFANEMITQYSKNKKYEYKVQFLTTTVYNYKELAKLYKEQMQVGFSKELSQIALGQSQSSILATAHFENDVLDLVNVFIPPLMSSTMNADILNRVKGGNASGADQSKTGGNQPTAAKVPGEEKQAGRKELSDDKKSDKTIQNRESMK